MNYGTTVDSTGGYASAQCPWCQLDSGGHHEPHCPLHPDNKPITPAAYGYGWVCPKCGAVYGPTVSECYRCNGPAPIITWSVPLQWTGTHGYQAG